LFERRRLARQDRDLYLRKFGGGWLYGGKKMTPKEKEKTCGVDRYFYG
jgi:hypothetical protein